MLLRLTFFSFCLSDRCRLLLKALYPLLMFVAVFRTLWIRIFPDVLLIFKPYDNDRSAPNSRGMQAPIRGKGKVWGARPSQDSVWFDVDPAARFCGNSSSVLSFSCGYLSSDEHRDLFPYQFVCSGGFFSRFKSSWSEDYSLFSWADKGQWETVKTENRQLSREGDWFRIGFEPVFVDYTKRGTWFVMVSLVEVGGEVFVRASAVPLRRTPARDVERHRSWFAPFPEAPAPPVQVADVWELPVPFACPMIYIYYYIYALTSRFASLGGVASPTTLTRPAVHSNGGSSRALRAFFGNAP